ncbi:hypothetical protein SCP_0212340 [Sparassis crispa]|uniref:Uncharacterized protein n=1 Tax=Sparassis crispa TaxID=139825 RepID=A0A401GCZ6_9APHY|nr:hypothetical protein SCP_0212340 [Sparassis crispa]GBE80032.1 hypothetical protein SCP_0212340 [Sparassis crispa]
MVEAAEDADLQDTSARWAGAPSWCPWATVAALRRTIRSTADSRCSSRLRSASLSSGASPAGAEQPTSAL